MLRVGEAVEVHTRYTGKWSRGFEVAEVVGSQYRLRRVSDQRLLPELTSPSDLRSAARPGEDKEQR